MKNIYLEITPFFPTKESFRGPYIYDQVKAIKDNSDFEVIVIKPISIFDKNIEKNYVYQNIKVFNFIVYDLPSSILPGIFQSLNIYRLKKFIKDIIKIDISEIKYIHSHVVYPAGMLGVSVGKQFKIKNFIQHHGFDVFQEDNGRILKGKLKELNKKFMYKSFIKLINDTNLNIGVSQKVIDIIKTKEDYKNNNSYVLYNGVNIDKFYKINSDKNNTIFTIGCIGNFWELKDQITLIKALKNLIDNGQKNILIKFIGSGITLDSCKDFIKKNNLENNIEFFKELDHTELNIFYNSLNLFVLPSYYEAFGCVYTESLQVGIPIIAIKNQGIEEVLTKEDKLNMLINKSDYRELAKKILLFKNNEIQSNSYNFDINLFIKDFLNYLKENIDENI